MHDLIDETMDWNKENQFGVREHSHVTSVVLGVFLTYTQYPIIRNGDQAPLVGFLKNSPI